MDATPLRCATRRPAEHFGTLVQQARKRAGLTQQELADRTGLHRTTVVNWERGVSVPPNPDAFRAVCYALGIDPCGGVVALGYLTSDELRQAA